MARRKNYELIEKFYGDDENICFHFLSHKGKYVEKALPQFTDNSKNYLVVHSSFRPIVELFNEGRLEEYKVNIIPSVISMNGLWDKVESDRLYIDKPLTYYRKQVEGWKYTISSYKKDNFVLEVYGRTRLYSELELIIKELKSNQTIEINKL